LIGAPRRATLRHFLITSPGSMPRLTIDKATQLATRALRNAGASRAMAVATARALVAADTEGLAGHGLSRVALYAQHLREKRVDGEARPRVVGKKGGAV